MFPQAASSAPALTALSRKKSLIVEVGHGDAPIWRTLRKLPLTDQTYLGLDIKADVWPNTRSPTYDIEAGRSKIMDRARMGFDCVFMFIDQGGELPVPDARSSETYFSQVLNDPRIMTTVVHKLLEESARITQKGGFMVIQNGAPIIADYGDVFVESGSRRIICKAGYSREHTQHDRMNPNTELLNDLFAPLSDDLYRLFLTTRGMPSHYDVAPGFDTTILVRR